MGLIYLDTCLLIYTIENHPVWAGEVRAALARETSSTFAISPLIKMECLVKPIKTGNLLLQRRYESALNELVQLPLPEIVFLQAAQLRARFGLKTPDALHLACAQHHNCAALWTNDDRLAQAAHGLARNVLSRG
ncbi:MAG: type II toxin-antitoxin system VapC family toxin [Pseudomonadota bacterium]